MTAWGRAGGNEIRILTLEIGCHLASEFAMIQADAKLRNRRSQQGSSADCLSLHPHMSSRWLSWPHSRILECNLMKTNFSGGKFRALFVIGLLAVTTSVRRAGGAPTKTKNSRAAADAAAGAQTAL